MNTFQKIIAGTCIIAIPFLHACKKDDPVSCNWVTEVQDESDALTVALNAYIADQSTANCNAYKVSFEAYLNALEDHKDCATTAGQGAEIQSSIDSARASLDALQC